MTEKTAVKDRDFTLCRSGLYEALALGFRPPNQETIDRLLSEEQNQALAEIAAILDEEHNGQQSGALSVTVRKMMNSSEAGCLESLENSFQYFFGHTAHSKVPPYETEYGTETMFQQPQQLGDITGFFAAFGLMLDHSQRERSDHISCECEFVSFLARKEAYALEKNDTRMLEITKNAQKMFLKDHLGRFSLSFANLLIREDPNSFYGVLGKLCRLFILLECTRLGVHPGPENLRLRPKVENDACFNCGSGEEVFDELGDSSGNRE